MVSGISVVIPTFNADRYIHKLLASIKSQTIPCEVVVIDSSSTDNTVSISKSFGVKIISIKKEDFNHGRARNLAALQTNGDIIVFLTQDALPFDAYSIERVVAPIENDVAASYGKQIPEDIAKPTEKFARYFNYPETPVVRGIEDATKSGIKTFFFSNVFSAVRRHEFEMMGGFPEDLIMFEDMIFAAKLMLKGYRIAYTPDAKVIHSHDYSWGEQFQRYLRAGVSFKKNSWFLEFARSDSEGIKFLMEEVKYLLQSNSYRWAMYAMIEAMFKYSGYKIGLNYDKIPYLRKKHRNE
ncbi:MAG: glycosyltransferase [Proteobacteria bacterium]|nr:glycosyltransferase [Pseudomonadota bacterium]